MEKEDPEFEKWYQPDVRLAFEMWWHETYGYNLHPPQLGFRAVAKRIFDSKRKK